GSASRSARASRRTARDPENAEPVNPRADLGPGEPGVCSPRRADRAAQRYGACLQALAAGSVQIPTLLPPVTATQVACRPSAVVMHGASLPTVQPVAHTW